MHLASASDSVQQENESFKRFDGESQRMCRWVVGIARERERSEAVFICADISYVMFAEQRTRHRYFRQ